MTFEFSDEVKELKQSGIRSASFRCNQLGGINLGQGICDIPVNDQIKQAAYESINGDRNTYAACEGVMKLRAELAKKIKSFNHVDVDPEKNILVSHGSTGSYVCAIQTLMNAGDEIILFEPFYGYHKGIAGQFGVKTKTMPGAMPDETIDFDKLKSLVSKKTKAIVVCTPCNPSGKVYTKDELCKLGDFAIEHDLMIITDEIYEYFLYPGYEHFSLASEAKYKNHVLTITGFSKTYNMTGWRVGYCYGPEELIAKMALVHDLFYVCPATPLQHAVVTALQLPQSYYDHLHDELLEQRDFVVENLQQIGFKVCIPQGAYYILADHTPLGFADDVEAANHLLEKAKVATVTGRSFFGDSNNGHHLLRFCYGLKMEVLQTAMERLKAVL